MLGVEAEVLYSRSILVRASGKSQDLCLLPTSACSRTLPWEGSAECLLSFRGKVGWRMEKWDWARGQLKLFSGVIHLRASGWDWRVYKTASAQTWWPLPATNVTSFQSRQQTFLSFFSFIVIYYTYIYLEVGNSKTKIPSNYCSGEGTFLAP